MMPRMALLPLALFLTLSAAGAPIPAEIKRLIPGRYDIDSPRLRHARAELEELLESCGAGVVEGSRQANRCSFRVKLDDLFFQPLERRTGLLPDPEWPHDTGVTFYEPPVTSVPDNFDLRDLMKNGEPDLRKQNCGDCWAWATHHGLEIARAVHEQKVVDHSVQTVLSCSRAGSCGGGYMSAVDFLKKGLPFEPDFPYAGRDRSCKYDSNQLQTGWEGKVVGTPYVGSSLQYSRAKRRADGTYDGAKVQNMMAAMYQWKAPLVVTVAAYSISGNGVYDSCSAINSGGNHMVAIVGWEMWNGKRVAHVWNSWGHGHGEKGVSRIVWECGSGRLNRGLGYSAKIVQYKPPCTPPDATQTYLHEIALGGSVEIGTPQPEGSVCSWLPREGLSDPDSCVTQASPSKTTEYHLKVENACGKSSSMALVYVWGGPRTADGKRVIATPFGDIAE